MAALFALTSLTVFAMMLTIGVNHSLVQLTSVWRQKELLLRSLFAVLVLVPALFALLLRVFDLPTEVATGLALLAAAPGAPLITQRSRMAAAGSVYVSSLQLNLALLAIVVTPLILGGFHRMFELDNEHVSPLQVASQVARVTLLPVSVGLLVKRFAPKLVEAIKRPLNAGANVLFLVLIVALLAAIGIVPALREKLLLGWPSIAAILIAATAAIFIGHLLGGPDRVRRAGLAVACVARNVGLAIFITGLSEDGAHAFPTILAYMLLGALVAIPYSVWIKRRSD